MAKDKKNGHSSVAVAEKAIDAEFAPKEAPTGNLPVPTGEVEVLDNVIQETSAPSNVAQYEEAMKRLETFARQLVKNETVNGLAIGQHFEDAVSFGLAADQSEDKSIADANHRLVMILGKGGTKSSVIDVYRRAWQFVQQCAIVNDDTVDFSGLPFSFITLLCQLQGGKKMMDSRSRWIVPRAILADTHQLFKDATGKYRNDKVKVEIGVRELDVRMRELAHREAVATSKLQGATQADKKKAETARKALEAAQEKLDKLTSEPEEVSTEPSAAAKADKSAQTADGTYTAFCEYLYTLSEAQIAEKCAGAILSCAHGDSPKNVNAIIDELLAQLRQSDYPKPKVKAALKIARAFIINPDLKAEPALQDALNKM